MRMKKNSWFGIGMSGAVAVGVFGLPTTDSAAPSRPNFVVLYVDDIDFDEMEPYDHRTFPCYTGAWEAGVYNPPEKDAYFMQTHWHARGERTYFKNPRQHTPNLKRLAQEGMRFDRFYVTSTVCTPSRYSLLTGNFASRCPALPQPAGNDLKNILWNTPLAPAEDNVVKQLNKLGYTTALFGKWHNHFYDPAAKKPYTWQNIYTGIAPDADARDPMVLEKIHAGYQRAINHLQTNIGFDVAGRLYPGNIHQSGLPASLRHNNLEWMTEGVLDFLKAPGENPFFLYFAINLPHRQNSVEENHSNPLATPRGFLEKAPTPFASRAELMAQLKERGVDPQQFCSTWIDAAVGAVLDRLDESGLSENTLVLVVSDHQSRGKFNCFEGARVPAFARWKGIVPSGSVSEALCANIDVAPTLLALAGSPDTKGKMDGQNLLPILRGKNPVDWRKELLLETGYTRALVSNPWKYIQNNPPKSVLDLMAADRKRSLAENVPRTVGWDGGPGKTKWGIRYGADAEFPHYFAREQLYNLTSDIFEQTNLISNADAASAAREMRALLNSWQTRLDSN